MAEFTTSYFQNYLQAHKAALDSIPLDQVDALVQVFRQAWQQKKQIFVFGNGGSAANASHFITDLSKGASDVLPARFRGQSLNDNTAWVTALGNDYAYDQVFVRQLMNFAQPGDLILVMSVSGNSPNLVKAVEWARENNVYSVALVGGSRGSLAKLADFVIAIDSTHYGRVEDAHMAICHMICYAFMEQVKVSPTEVML